METNRIEYKRQYTNELDLEKEVIAFLNYREGGLIYFGIDDMGNVSGIDNTDNIILKIKDRIKNNILPSPMGLFDIVNQVKDNKTIIKIIIAAGSEKPYFKRKYGMTEKGCFIRTGTAAEPMPQHLIEQYFSTRTRNSIGKIKSPRNDLTFEQLRIYYQEKDKSLNSNFKKNLELLNEDGNLNYVAYLLADENNISVKVARYSGTDRNILIENAELGYCSLVKAAKNVINKIDLINTTISRITSKERIDNRLWNPIALKEAIINAFVHNDFTREIAPKFEIFDDRIEITSAGSLPDGLSQSEFFEGYSIPRNKELMRIFKDLELVEQLGSGVPRILESYNKECFLFTTNFTRLVFPAVVNISEHVNEHVTEHVTEHVNDIIKKLISVMDKDYNRKQLMELTGISHREHFRTMYLQKAIESGLVELTIPDKPRSIKQKYRLTQKGIELKKLLEK